MKKMIFLALLASLPAVCFAAEEAAKKPTPPTAKQALRIILENGNFPIKGANLCWLELSSASEPDAPTIGAYLASHLAEDAQWFNENFKKDPEERRTAVSFHCGTGLVMIEQKDGTLIPAWPCSLYFIDGMKGNPFIASFGVNVGIKEDLSGIVKDSVSCSP